MAAHGIGINIPQNKYAYASVSPVGGPNTGPKTSPHYSVQSRSTSSLGQVGRKPRWRPFTLKAPFILLFLFTTVAVIAVIEFLYQKSERNKGLFFADNLNDFTFGQTFSYKYLMTVISVLYGMAWASVDLDVKRLEPFFQLAQKGGAKAKDSILLCYPFDFLALVPITALMRRHWSVFFSGFALVLIFWVITPMQAAFLGTKPVSLDVPTDFVHYRDLLSMTDQNGSMITAQYFYTAYGVAWLGEQLSPFTTTEFAATPFKPLNVASDRLSKGNETWTAVTRTYTTDLDCIAGIKVDPAQPFNFTNGEGCGENLGGIWITNQTRNIQYYSFGNYQGMADYYLSNYSCKGGPHIFAAAWTRAIPGNDKDFDVTKVYCKPTYHYVDSKITVDASTLLIQSSEQVSEPVSFNGTDGIINVDRFEFDVSTAMVQVQPTKDFPTDLPPAGQSKFADWGLARPTRQVMYAVGMSQNYTFDDLQDPVELGRAFARAHKLLFANFVYRCFKDIPEADIGKNTISGDRSVRKLAVVVVRLFARLLEAFLVIVAVCFVALGILTYRRNANLFGDPDSLAAKMALVAESKQLLDDFDGLDEAPDLSEGLPERTYRLDQRGDGYYRIDIEEENEATPADGSFGGEQYTGAAIRPLILNLNMGIVMTVFLASMLGFLIFLYKTAQKNDGLPSFSDSQIVVGLIYSVVPTIFATGMEPFWVLLTRYFCVYQPYTELSKGRASSSRSLAIKYTNVPPALVLFRALRANHLMLFALSGTALLANLLAVSLGGLFENEFRLIGSPTTISQPFAPQIVAQINPSREGNSISYRDAGTFPRDSQETWIAALSNITQNTPLPPWVSSEYYFLPFEWKGTENSSKAHKATTDGFGMDLDCQPLDSVGGQLVTEGRWRPSPSILGKSPFLSVNLSAPLGGGGTVPCYAKAAITGSGRPGQKVAMEYILRPDFGGVNATQEQAETCANNIIIGWGRGTSLQGNKTIYDWATVDPETGEYGPESYYPWLNDVDYHSVTLVCRPKVVSARFEVTVDANQRVQNYELVEGSEVMNPVAFFKDAADMRNFTAQVAAVATSFGTSSGVVAGWHNGTVANTITHYLLDSLLPENMSDPAQNLYSAEYYAVSYRKLFGRFFAIMVGQNAEYVFPANAAGADTLIDGFQINPVQRISVDTTMFYISAAIMGINFLVAMLAYSFRPKNFLPRFPDTLASEIGYFYRSKALEDVSGTVSMSSESRDNHLNRLGHRYGFGEFIGSDGKRHRGVERSSIIENKQ